MTSFTSSSHSKNNNNYDEHEEQKSDDFDFDRLERGDSKDMLADKCLLPTPVGRRIATGSYTSQHKAANSNTTAFNSSSNEEETNTEWHRCFIERSAKNKFRLYDEPSGNMLLSATKTKEGDFLISQYAAFPDEHESVATKSMTKSLASAFGMGSRSSSDAAAQYDDNQHCESLTDGRGKYGYVCTLRLNSSRTGYKLYRNGCELCDNVLQKYSCAGCVNDQLSLLPNRFKNKTTEAEKDKINNNKKGPPRANQAVSFSAHGDDANRTMDNIRVDRQLLAVIGQSMQEIEHTGVMARYTTMEIPAFLNPNAHELATEDHQGNTNSTPQRIVWCPRTLAAQVAGQGPAHVQAMLLGRGELNADDVHSSAGARGRRTSSLYADAAVPEKERFRYSCRLPNWSDDVGSLVLTFFGGRVLQPSAKNFMMEDKTAVESARKSNGNGPGVKDAKNVMFQFGKVNKGKFNLDFKHPMSPLQSFALALSSFAFTSKD